MNPFVFIHANTYQDFFHACIDIIKTFFPLRLHAALEPILEKLETHYATFSQYITDLKMDHQDGKAESDELKQFLVYQT